MKTMKIPLTQGKVALVDAEDYEYLMQWKWYYLDGYAVRHCPRPATGLIRMHRTVLERMGFEDFEDSDHRDRNRSDNRRRNLRAVTHHQNNYNRSKQTNNTSGYTGVYWHRQVKKWCARLKVNGKYKHLGLFTDKEDAARVYNTAARMYHGEFSVLNKV
jgi:hypothetical protein